MNDSYEHSNYEEEYSIQDVLDDFDKYCSTMKRDLEDTFDALKGDLKTAKSQLNRKNNDVQASSIMGIVVPLLSDLWNEVLDTDDVDIIRETFAIKYRYLKNRLSDIGVELNYHERGEKIALEDKVRGVSVPIGDPTQDQTCCRCVSMGWTVKGSERMPTLEEIKAYKYDKSLDDSLPKREGSDCEEPRAPQNDCMDKKKYAEDQVTKQETLESSKFDEHQVDPSQKEWIEASVPYDIYIKHPDQDEPHYVARPVGVCRIFKVIEFDKSLKGSVIYNGVDDFEIVKNVDKIITKWIEKKKRKKILGFYLDGEDDPVFTVKCQ